MLAGIETGGTKIFCGVAEAEDPTTIVDKVRIPTTSPDEALSAVRDFLDEHCGAAGPEAIGVASFGPLDTNPTSSTYGFITSTPKPGWAQTDLHNLIPLTGFNSPISFITDVSGSLLGEREAGAARGLENVAYATVGTGIGVGILSGGTLVTGHGTPELGHILVRRHPDDSFDGMCPYHGDCLEGLACGPAIEARWGAPAEGKNLEIVSYYVAQLLLTITLSVAPERIVIGGGVMKTPGMMESARATYSKLVADYLPPVDLDSYIVPPALGDFSGLTGALVLAKSLIS
ncbi:ROK family protein [Arcanobacterium haemolyticum]|nr:ROK family protein [Arcanobacterium haemolyticum]